MQYRGLGKTGLMVSELCLGTMTFGRELDEEGSRAMISRFLEAGVYEAGASEEIVGRAIRGIRRARSHGAQLARARPSARSPRRPASPTPRSR
jgi:aryl-alcohol dehydrogenase-like predicted oxidoreductase